jgi:hypothetical protein
MSFDSSEDAGAWMARTPMLGRDGSPGDDCTILALGSFSSPVTKMGHTEGREIDEGSDSTPCATLDRTDRCCNVIQRVHPREGSAVGSGVIYKDGWPQIFLAYVLAHEIGHYVGLCHYGHDGLHNVMYTIADQPPGLLNLQPVVPGTLWGLYRDSEPRFSLDDAKNCWRFLINQMPHCLALEAAPTPVE